MWSESIDTTEFLGVVRPALQRGCAQTLARVITERWSPQQLCQLLREPCGDVKKAACLVLGLVGDASVMQCLAHALHDGDPKVNELAEHALWSIWFRGGSGEAQGDFQRGLAALEANKSEEAIVWFRRAHEVDPNFAEAYNQCAIAHYMLEQWEEAAEDCQKTVDLIPIHFGALAGLGHCYAQMGRFFDAAKMYRRAIAVHPTIEGIADALDGIEKCVSDA